MRRPGPRPIGWALEEAVAQAAPATLLARVQSRWTEAVGEALAGEAEPVSEHGGTVTVTCSTASWAQELELLSPELLERLNGALGGPGDTPVAGLRFRAARRPPGGGRGFS